MSGIRGTEPGSCVPRGTAVGSSDVTQPKHEPPQMDRDSAPGWENTCTGSGPTYEQWENAQEVENARDNIPKVGHGGVGQC